MEENVRMPEGFFDKEKLLVDKEIADPFLENQYSNEIYMHPFNNGESKGYIRYKIEGKSLIILDCVIDK
jgi:hypothetical protein